MLWASVILAGCSFETPSVKTEDTKTDMPKVGQFGAPPETDAAAGSAAAQQQSTTSTKQTLPANNPSETPSMNTTQTYATPPTMQIDANKRYSATLKTSAGEIVIALRAKETPVTVNNFVFLAREKFYDKVIFHRTIQGFMIQGGDPTGTGMGGPGYQFDDEPFTGEYKRGTVAMANAGANTNGSQFFIMHADMALSKHYVIFGEVTQGIEVVDKIAQAPVQAGGEGSKPVMPIEIQSVSIAETP